MPELAALEVKSKGTLEITVRVTFTSAEMRPEPSEEDAAGKDGTSGQGNFHVYRFLASLSAVGCSVLKCLCVVIPFILYSCFFCSLSHLFGFVAYLLPSDCSLLWRRY